MPASLLRSFLVLCAFAAGSGPAVAAEVVSRMLDNGLEVLVSVDNRAPVVVSQIWYGVGASTELPGQTGISHVLEHMMFRGTPDHPGDAFSRTIAAAGGRDNAFTSRDFTAYYEIIGSDQLALTLKLEADRMQNLLLDENDFQKELDVVKEERRWRTDDKPEGLAYEQLQATAFQHHPYGQPVIGWMQDLEQLTAEQLRAWHQHWYSPNNARLVVVGDVEPQNVFDLAEEYFGAIPARTLLPPPLRREPTQRGPRLVELQIPAQTPYLMMGFKTPALNQLPDAQHWEAYALSMLTSILDGGNSSRLATRLVRGRKLAAAAGASYSLYGRDNGLLLLDGTPSPDHSRDELKQALLDEIQQLQEQLVDEVEMQRARAQVIAQMTYSQDSLRHRAYMIGQLETVGLGWEVEDQLIDRYQQVTAEQVREVAQRYLTDHQLTVVTLDPQSAAVPLP